MLRSGAIAVVSLVMWSLDLWNWFVAGLQKHLELWAREDLEMWYAEINVSFQWSVGVLLDLSKGP